MPHFRHESDLSQHFLFLQEDLHEMQRRFVFMLSLIFPLTARIFWRLGNVFCGEE